MALSEHNTIIVADDHPLFRDALSHAISKLSPGAAIVEADSLESLQRVVEAHPDADLLLLDLNMPGVSGFSALAYIRKAHESLPTVIVSALDDPAVIRRAIQHGASGFIPKSSSMEDAEGNMASSFIVISNMNAAINNTVKRGAERVLRARLEDR